LSKLDLLRNLSFFSGLSEPQLLTVAESVRWRAFAKGTIIFDQSSTDATLCVIESGRVRIFLISEFGEEISLQIYDRGQCFGEFAALDGQPRSAGAIALEDVVTYALHRDDLLRHLEASLHMPIHIIQVLTTRLRYTTRQMENQAFLDVGSRVATKLHGANSCREPLHSRRLDALFEWARQGKVRILAPQRMLGAASAHLTSTPLEGRIAPIRRHSLSRAAPGGHV
jgi:CRP-like cAMP-binding protein